MGHKRRTVCAVVPTLWNIIPSPEVRLAVTLDVMEGPEKLMIIGHGDPIEIWSLLNGYSVCKFWDETCVFVLL